MVITMRTHDKSGFVRISCNPASPQEKYTLNMGWDNRVQGRLTLKAYPQEIPFHTLRLNHAIPKNTNFVAELWVTFRLRSDWITNSNPDQQQVHNCMHMTGFNGCHSYLDKLDLWLHITPCHIELSMSTEAEATWQSFENVSRKV